MANSRNATTRATAPVEEFEMDDDVDVVPDDDVVVLSDDEVASEMTMTSNFMGASPQIVDQVEDSGVQIKDGQKTYRCRAIVDVGPVFYGHNEWEMTKGVAYDVPEHIYQYLKERNLLWDQQ